MASECLDVTAQRRHLEGHVISHDRDGAVLESGGNGVQSGLLGKTHHVGGKRRRGNIDVLDGGSHQRVAHRAADGARLGTLCREGGKDPARLRPLQPLGSAKIWEPPALLGARHRISRSYSRCPGSIWPFLNAGGI